MPITRIARTHLVYQFIILTLLLLGLNYYELAADRKFTLFIGCLPIILYQLMILSCFSELLPVPRWMSPNEFHESGQENIVKEASDNLSELPAHPNLQTTSSIETPCPVHCKVVPRTKKYRKWNINNAESHHQSPEMSLNGPTDQSVSIPESSIPESEITKTYFFPYRQKRLERWIESKEDIRPFKLRSWETNRDNSEVDTQPADSSTLDGMSTEDSVNRRQMECQQTGWNVNPTEFSVDTSLIVEESDLEKSYSFPFRQKRLKQWVESKELENSSNSPSTPYWKSLGYSVAVKQEARRRRRSVSSSQLTRCQMGSPIENERHKEFSQSVEISSTPTVSNSNFRRSTSKTSMTTLSKLKMGFNSCLSKMRKESNKSSDKSHENKRSSFKSLFQSRENIDLETPVATDERTTNGIHLNECKPCFYPSYIPFEKQRFELDVQKRMSELSRA